MRASGNVVPLTDQPLFVMHRSKVFREFHKSLKGAGITGLRFHDLRHTATTRLFEKGLGIMEVSSITGHSDLKMLKRYTHLRAEDLVARMR